MIKNIFFTVLSMWRKNYWELKNHCGSSIACLHRLKHCFNRLETARENLLFRKTSLDYMWEFITESGMIKNIYLTVMSIWRKRLLITAKSIWQLNSMFHHLKHFFHGRETATESLSCKKTSTHFMWEFITESAIIKNIYFIHLLN